VPDRAGKLQETFGGIQGTFGGIQGTFGGNQGTFGGNQGTCGGRVHARRRAPQVPDRAGMDTRLLQYSFSK
jgi:hypothetical protein